VAHAEASARTVDAAVTVAAAQLGLRSDQVDVEVLEEPVPSTFGYIGSPARVRVTPRTTPSNVGAEPGVVSVGSGMAGPAEGGAPAGEPAGGGSSGGGSVGGGAAEGGAGPMGAGTEPAPDPTDRPTAQKPLTDPNVSNDAGIQSGSVSASPRALARPPATTETGNGQVLADHSTQPRDHLAVQTQEGPTSSQEELDAKGGPGSAEGPGHGGEPGLEEDYGREGGPGSEGPGSEGPSSKGSGPEGLGSEGLGSEGPGPEGPGSESLGSSESVAESVTGLAPSAPSASSTPADVLNASAPTAPPAPPAPGTSVTPDSPAASAAPAPPTPLAAPEAATSPSPLSTPEAVASPATARSPRSTAPAAARREESGSTARETRPPRRTYKDEPIEPQMVEEDTERAGDFLEGLLDALDVDGDITTWVDEVGGHIDLEGTDLEVLVGPNGETLDALQELTRLAVLRQSKRRVRLLIDINGFRARQREQLTSMVRATVEQVIRTREDHELQPMSPAERKIVHDAVAAIDGARTESLGEEPNRRVVIRPA
jgi:spoIIIJ-associated protein